MDIVCATSDEYSRLALVSIQSLLSNSRDVDDLTIHYIGNKLSDASKLRLSSLAAQHNRKLAFYEMPEEFDRITGTMRANPVVYSYCFFQDILPKDVDKVLLLESDAIVLSDIREFYETDISGFYLAAVDDTVTCWYKRWLKMRDDSPYFNSGVVLFNLKKMREDGVSGKLRELIKQGGSKFFYEAQDELNVFCEGKYKLLPPRFASTSMNFAFDHEGILRYRHPKPYYTKEEISDACRKPIVVHFTKSVFFQSHPWRENCTHPYRDAYLNYKSQTEAKDDPLWKNTRKAQKIGIFFYDHFPHHFVASLFGATWHLCAVIRMMFYKRLWK